MQEQVIIGGPITLIRRILLEEVKLDPTTMTDDEVAGAFFAYVMQLQTEEL
jgi:hypothetical protein